jgi:hypothetical protein
MIDELAIVLAVLAVLLAGGLLLRWRRRRRYLKAAERRLTELAAMKPPEELYRAPDVTPSIRRAHTRRTAPRPARKTRRSRWE